MPPFASGCTGLGTDRFRRSPPPADSTLCDALRRSLAGDKINSPNCRFVESRAVRPASVGRASLTHPGYVDEDGYESIGDERTWTGRSPMSRDPTSPTRLLCQSSVYNYAEVNAGTLFASWSAQLWTTPGSWGNAWRNNRRPDSSKGETARLTRFCLLAVLLVPKRHMPCPQSRGLSSRDCRFWFGFRGQVGWTCSVPSGLSPDFCSLNYQARGRLG